MILQLVDGLIGDILLILGAFALFLVSFSFIFDFSFGLLNHWYLLLDRLFFCKREYRAFLLFVVPLVFVFHVLDDCVYLISTSTCLY